MFVVFVGREVVHFIRNPPMPGKPRMGDCLSTNAVLGGDFRADEKTYLRDQIIVFRPHPARAGHYFPKSIAVLTGFCCGLSAGLPRLWGASLLAMVVNALCNKDKIGPKWNLWAEVAWIAAAQNQLQMCPENASCLAAEEQIF